MGFESARLHQTGQLSFSHSSPSQGTQNPNSAREGERLKEALEGGPVRGRRPKGDSQYTWKPAFPRAADYVQVEPPATGFIDEENRRHASQAEGFLCFKLTSKPLIHILECLRSPVFERRPLGDRLCGNAEMLAKMEISVEAIGPDAGTDDNLGYFPGDLPAGPGRGRGDRSTH